MRLRKGDSKMSIRGFPRSGDEGRDTRSDRSSVNNDPVFRPGFCQRAIDGQAVVKQLLFVRDIPGALAETAVVRNQDIVAP